MNGECPAQQVFLFKQGLMQYQIFIQDKNHREYYGHCSYYPYSKNYNLIDNSKRHHISSIKCNIRKNSLEMLSEKEFEAVSKELAGRMSGENGLAHMVDGNYVLLREFKD